VNAPVQAIVGTVVGAVAGFLTRPCCVIPAALSLLGVGGAGLAQAIVAYRPALLSISAVLLTASIWMTFRREGGWFPKTLAASATILAFAFSASSIGLF
jgi:hypothetical protein